MRMLRKFKFSDLNLAMKVRGNMLQALVKFDIDNNKTFDQQEIKQALISILGESQSEVHYVVKNVSRYDKNNDGAITYDEFTNFSVEQHFGELAIQRLHRKGYYSNGARRVMNLEEFTNTLNYCLSFINSKGTNAEYQNLFNQVDLDQDGFISYEDYFIFLKEYFGSKSQAYEIELATEKELPPPPPPPQPKPLDGNKQSAEQRFAKLIYNQLKITIMEKDKNRNLLIDRNEAEDILSNVFKLSYNDLSQIEDKAMNFANTVKYEDFMRTVVVFYLCELDPKKSIGLGQEIDEKSLIEIINRATHFVSIKPADSVLQACMSNVSGGSATISKNQYISMMRNIFENFKFDTRGLPANKIQSGVASNRLY